MVRVDLGNPDYVENWLSVDLYPRDSRVERCEATYWLSQQEPESIDEIRAFLLIEHLPSPGTFFQLTHRTLKLGGKLTIKTDNAEFFPFYLPVLNMLGFGAHSSDKYRAVLDRTDWVKHPEATHFCIFTKRHLQNYAQHYGFEVVSIKRDWKTIGARLIAVYRKV